jgi:hypothetical protein
MLSGTWRANGWAVALPVARFAALARGVSEDAHVHRFRLDMQDFFCANGDKKRIEQAGHIVDRSAHFCQELFAVRLTIFALLINSTLQ